MLAVGYLCQNGIIAEKKNRFTLTEHKNCLTHFFFFCYTALVRSSSGASPFQLITRALQSFSLLTFVSKNFSQLSYSRFIIYHDDKNSSSIGNYLLNVFNLFLKNILKEV